jgi:hypothetical protein
VAAWCIMINCMEQSPRETNNNSVSQEISHLLWNHKVHYCVNKGLPLVPILIQINLVHISPPYIPKIHSNIIFPPTPRSSEHFLPFRFSSQDIVCICVMIYKTKCSQTTVHISIGVSCVYAEQIHTVVQSFRNFEVWILESGISFFAWKV